MRRVLRKCLTILLVRLDRHFVDSLDRENIAIIQTLGSGRSLCFHSRISVSRVGIQKSVWPDWDMYLLVPAESLM